MHKARSWQSEVVEELIDRSHTASIRKIFDINAAIFFTMIPHDVKKNVCVCPDENFGWQTCVLCSCFVCSHHICCCFAWNLLGIWCDLLLLVSGCHMLLEHVSCFHMLLEHSFCGHSTNRFNKQTLSLTQNMHTKHSQTFTPPTLFLSPVRTQKPYTRHQPTKYTPVSLTNKL